jgi:hypothetical protein
MASRFAFLTTSRCIWLAALALVACHSGGDDDSLGTGIDSTFETTADDDVDADSSDEDTDDADTTTGDGDGDTTTGDGDGDTTTGDGDGDTTTGDGDGDPLVPPAGESSGGMGGGVAAGTPAQAGNISYYLIAPGSAGPYPLMIVYSGVEGAGLMTQNLLMVQEFVGASNFVFAVLDGVTYNGNGDAGATVLDAVRGLYDIDNDRTYLLSESAGTTAGLELGFELRQSYFAAFWANDVNASGGPTMTAAQLGFQPYGNAGPGGDWPDANAIVSAMQAADYRTPPPAPYNGPGSDIHGDPNQFIAAMQWFPGKTRQ